LKAISFDQTPKEVLDEEQIFDIPWLTSQLALMLCNLLGSIQ